MIVISSHTESDDSPRRGWLKLALRVAASAALLAWIYPRLDLGAVGRALAHVSPATWCASVLLYLAAHAISAYRWSLLTTVLGFPASVSRVAQIYFSGMFFNLCLPTSIGGDMYKACALGDSTSRRVLAGLSVLADRAIGMLALVLVAAVGWCCTAGRLGWIGGAALTLVVTACSALVCSFALGLIGRQQASIQSLPLVGPVVQRVWPLVAARGALVRALAWSFAVQWLNVLLVALLGRALGIRVPLVVYVAAVPTVALATVLPLSISGIGVREGGLALVLARYGVSGELGASLGLAWFGVAVAVSLLGGIIYLASHAPTAARFAPVPSPSLPAPHWQSTTEGVRP